MPVIALARRMAGSILRDVHGGIMVEMAFAAPLLILAGLGGAELTNFVLAKQRISAIARMTADNGARLGENSSLQQKQVTESDINDVLTGADQQSQQLNLKARGRVILSSLERNSSGGQWIHWQRCLGAKSYASTQGVEGAGATGTAFPGMDNAFPKIQAPAGSAVMFVEIAYDYRPLVSIMGTSRTIVDTASYLIRERRDLSQLYNPDGVTPSRC